MNWNATRPVRLEVQSKDARRVPRWGWRTGLLLLALISGGCAAGVQWEIGPYADMQRRAAAADKLTFIYFRSWYLVECTQFEENVLKDPEVLAELRSVVAVPLDFDYDQPLAQQWGIDDRPAYVIVSPDRTVLSRNQIPITKQELLEDLRGAKDKFAMSRPQSTESGGGS